MPDTPEDEETAIEREREDTEAEAPETEAIEDEGEPLGANFA